VKKVLLTGATGYIGQFAVRYLLDKNYIVHAVTSKPLTKTSNENLIWHEVNLLKPYEVKDLIERVHPTHLLHFAWYVEHGKFWNASENLDWLQMSLSLAKQFVENGGKRIVVSGTCAEYDWTNKGPFFEFGTPFRPHTLYGAAKNSMSLTLEKYGKASDCSFASGKVFFSFGANESPNRLIPSVIRSLLENKLAETSHGNQIRDFLYVEDIAKAFVELLESEVVGAVNIASGKGIKLKKIIEIIANIIGRPELLRVGALPVSKDEPLEIVADMTRLHKEVGFKENYNLKERLKETINWWRENL
jgi:nucleoside-diphosphate-sugar epimerase